MKELIKVQCDKTVETVVTLAKSIWNKHYVPLIGQGQVDYMLEKFQSFTEIKKQTESGYSYYILNYNNSPSGYFALKHDRDTKSTFVSKLYVSDNFRGEGLGIYLLDNIKKIAKDSGTNSLWLTVNRHNNNSINWYKNRNFYIKEEAVADIGNGYVMDDYILEMKL